MATGDLGGTKSSLHWLMIKIQNYTSQRTLCAVFYKRLWQNYVDWLDAHSQHVILILVAPLTAGEIAKSSLVRLKLGRVIGPNSISRHCLTSIGKPIVAIRWSQEHLISTISFYTGTMTSLSYRIKVHFLIKTFPSWKFLSKWRPHVLTHWGLVMPTTTRNLINIGSGTSLLIASNQYLNQNWLLVQIRPLGIDFSEI